MTKPKTNRSKRKGKGSRGSRHAPPTNAFQEGNPGGPGRPKDDPELIEAFRSRTPKALAVLDRVLDGYLAGIHKVGNTVVKPPPAKDAVAASAVVLDRGWGKAPATIKLAGHDGGPVKGTVTHTGATATPQEALTLAQILARAKLLAESGAFDLAKVLAEKKAEERTETADPVETKEQG